MDYFILFISIFIFAFGLCIGSFLNCVIYRLEENKTLEGRSFCPNCKHTLAFYDLFPVFSFLSLGGKCRYCKNKISWQYPLVEIFTGVLFVLIFNYSPGLSDLRQYISILFLFYVASALIVIFVYDFKHSLIPDKILFPATIITLAYNFIPPYNWQNISYNFISAIGAFTFFLLIFLVTKGRGMGFGDVKLAILMGLFLGFPNILLALFLAFFFGAIIGLILMILPAHSLNEKKTLKSEIPFGPFLILGTFIALFWGDYIIQWYSKNFLI